MDRPLVVLVGGSSATGKTELARQLAREWDGALLLVDDLRLALQRATSVEAHPDLHVFSDPAFLKRMQPEAVRDGLIAICRALAPALEIVVAHHLHAALPTVIEGDGILPALAAQDSFAGRNAEGRVRAVFLAAASPSALLESAQARGRSLEQLSVEEQHTYAKASYLFGQWLCDEARRCLLPVISSAPFASLPIRVRSALIAPRRGRAG